MGGERVRRRVGLGLTGDQLSERCGELLLGGFLGVKGVMSLVDSDAGVERGVAGLAIGRRPRRPVGSTGATGNFAASSLAGPECAAVALGRW
jgi:hypothetical protein